MKTCRKCNGECKPSKALLNQLVSFDDFENDAGNIGTTQSRVGEAKLVDCYKCENCGHSFIPEMSNEEKLKQLLQIAVENGWKTNNTFYDNIIKYNLSVFIDSGCLTIETEDSSQKSLNDLVTNFEEGEISFIEALWQVSDIDKGIFTHFNSVESVRFNWVNLPTSQRLDWLFDTFKHLLDEKSV